MLLVVVRPHTTSSRSVCIAGSVMKVCRRSLKSSKEGADKANREGSVAESRHDSASVATLVTLGLYSTRKIKTKQFAYPLVLGDGG
jgi:hypothetical protein